MVTSVGFAGFREMGPVMGGTTAEFKSHLAIVPSMQKNKADEAGGLPALVKDALTGTDHTVLVPEVLPTDTVTPDGGFPFFKKGEIFQRVLFPDGVKTLREPQPEPSTPRNTS